MIGVEDTVPIPVPPVAPVAPPAGRHRRLDPGSWHPRTLALATGRLKVVAAGLGLVLAGGVFVVAPVLTAEHRPLPADAISAPGGMPVAPTPVPEPEPLGAPMDTTPPEITTTPAPVRHVPKPAPVHRMTLRPPPKPAPPSTTTPTPQPAPSPAPEVTVTDPPPQTVLPAAPVVPAVPPPPVVAPGWTAPTPDNGWQQHRRRDDGGYNDEHQQWSNSETGRGDHWNSPRDNDSDQGQDDGGGPLISVGGLP